MSAQLKKIHIVGVCGTAMGQLAGLLKEKGFSVSGSDQQCYPPVSTMIDQLGIELHTGNFQKENVGNADLVVVGNVVREHNPEAVFAKENDIPLISMPEALAKYVFGDSKKLVIAGTHGKTTTTGLVTHIFEEAGKQPGYMIGGVPCLPAGRAQGKEKGYGIGGGEYAVFEGDEYDTCYFDKRSKFLHYDPHSAIITSLELDHLDIFSNMEEYTKAFSDFASLVHDDGFLFINDSYEGLKEVAKHSKAQVYFYGGKETSEFRYQDLEQQGEFQKFEVVFENKVLGEIKTPLSGDHNVANIVASVGLAYKHGISFEDIQKAVKTFGGMKRRQEVIYNEKGIIVMDDFAHHPTAVKTTVAGVKRKYPNKRLIALYEPTTRSSRKKMFEEDYISAFDGADFVCIKMPKLGKGEEESEVIDLEKITNELEKKGIQAQYYLKTEELLDDITPSLKEDDLVLIMSHGEFDKVRKKLIDKLE